jgi:hypothetical protein
MVQLLKNDGISFLAAKNFIYAGEEYVLGQEFPQEEARNIETLVRARFVIPVLEEGHLKPRHWHTHIRTREEAEEYLNRDRVQLVWPTEPDSAIDLDVLTNPELTPEPEGPGEDALAPTPDDGEVVEPEQEPIEEGSDMPQYDPADHTVDEVKGYLTKYPEETDRVLAMEAAGRGRKGLLEE